MKSMKLTLIASVVAATLLLSGTQVAFAQTMPSAKIVSIVPTSVDRIHTVIFQVCAGSETSMRAPEVVVRSLAEVKSVSLNKVIAKGTCTTTSTQLSAFDAKNIRIQVVDKTVLNKLVDKAEQKLIQLRTDIALTNEQLQDMVLTMPGNTPTQKTEIAKINDISSKLSELRKEVRDAKSEYYRLLYLLQAS